MLFPEYFDGFLKAFEDILRGVAVIRNQELGVGHGQGKSVTEVRDHRITDVGLREYLDQLFSSYCEHDGSNARSVFVCSVDGLVVRSVNCDYGEALRLATDALCFASIGHQTEVGVCADNPSWGPPTADAFETYIQRFRIGDDRIAVDSGGTLSGGWRIGEIRFQKPLSTGGKLWQPDKTMIAGLDTYLTAGPGELDGGALATSLHWFRLAHATWAPYYVKVVLMATAFESLFRISRKQKALQLARHVNECYQSYELELATRPVDGQETELSLAGWWMYDFYRLRNDAVHEGILPREKLEFRGWIHGLIVADLVFTECVRHRLFSMKCLGDKERALAEMLDQPNEQAARILMRKLDVVETLGWM